MEMKNISNVIKVPYYDFVILLRNGICPKCRGRASATSTTDARIEYMCYKCGSAFIIDENSGVCVDAPSMQEAEKMYSRFNEIMQKGARDAT